ncbi:MAG: PqiC family protein, partial [Steroidobacteraceae bacterium]
MTRINAHSRSLLIPAIATLALAACASSPPTQFYSLSAVSAGSETGTAAGSSSIPPVRVAAVHIPPALDRREIVRTRAGDRLDVSGVHRWGAPFDEMVQHVLTQDLISRLPRGKVVLPAGPAPSRTDAIVIDLLQFQSDAAGSVVL